MRITVKNSLSIATIMVIFLVFIVILLSLMKIDRKVIVPGTFTYRNISPVIIEEDGFVQADEAAIAYYQRELERNNITVNIRHSRGKDIDAACGQLANKTTV